MYFNRVFAILFLLASVILTSCTSSQVEYKDRAYQGPPKVYHKEELIKKFGKHLKPTDDKVNGMRVMLSNREEKVLGKYNTVPTILILKKSDDQYWVYSLKGGP